MGDNKRGENKKKKGGDGWKEGEERKEEVIVFVSHCFCSTN
jgi:hypothetical protein